MTQEEIKLALEALIGNATASSDQAALFQQVRQIIYGEHGWDSRFRLDNFEVTRRGVHVAFSSRSLKAVHVRRNFEVILRRVA